MAGASSGSDLRPPRPVKLVEDSLASLDSEEEPDVRLPPEVRLEIAQRMYRETCYTLEVLRANTSLKQRFLKVHPDAKETVKPQLDKLVADAETVYAEARLLWQDVKGLEREVEDAKQRRSGTATLSVKVEQDD